VGPTAASACLWRALRGRCLLQPELHRGRFEGAERLLSVANADLRRFSAGRVTRRAIRLPLPEHARARERVITASSLSRTRERESSLLPLSLAREIERVITASSLSRTRERESSLLPLSRTRERESHHCFRFLSCRCLSSGSGGRLRQTGGDLLTGGDPVSMVVLGKSLRRWSCWGRACVDGRPGEELASMVVPFGEVVQ
jgi:hypothetical protein